MDYEESWDCPHVPLPDPLWQESDCYWFWDPRLRVGGFHRIGQSPASGRGHVMLFVFAEGGERFVHYGTPAITSADRHSRGQRAGTSYTNALGGGRMQYCWNEQDCDGELTFADGFYLPRDWSRSGHGVAAREKMNAGGHLECSGRIRGRIRLGSRELTIDALGHRDRSWGARDGSVVTQHRMFSGTVGPALSVACFSLAMRNGHRHAAGFVVRDGVETDISRVRILATLDTDGLSVLGGEAQLTLVSGEELSIPCRSRQGFLSVTQGYVSTDSIAEMRLGTTTGFCDLEVANNPLRGVHVPDPNEADLIAIQQGLSPCSDYGQ